MHGLPAESLFILEGEAYIANCMVLLCFSVTSFFLVWEEVIQWTIYIALAFWEMTLKYQALGNLALQWVWIFKLLYYCSSCNSIYHNSPFIPPLCYSDRSSHQGHSQYSGGASECVSSSQLLQNYYWPRHTILLLWVLWGSWQMGHQVGPVGRDYPVSPKCISLLFSQFERSAVAQQESST